MQVWKYGDEKIPFLRPFSETVAITFRRTILFFTLLALQKSFGLFAAGNVKVIQRIQITRPLQWRPPLFTWLGSFLLYRPLQPSARPQARRAS
jgi:hypothetical protein